MYTILEESTGKVLFAKLDNEVLEGQLAIKDTCTLNNPENLGIYWDFENKIFYLK